MHDVLSAFGLKEGEVEAELFGSGLINRTWKLTSPGKQFILQKVNQQVFAEPEKIVHNCRLIAEHLRKHRPGYAFIAPITSAAGDELVYLANEGCFRLFPFVAGSHSKDVVETPQQAYEAARQFGRFTCMLSDMDVTKLNITIPRFHDLALRYCQFLQAEEKGNPARRKACRPLIKELLGYRSLVERYDAIKRNPAFKLRVTHHDTKIGNVLFDGYNKGICVVDLDTVMPGYFISDVGDMMRTYLSPVSEEESDLSKINVREDFYNAVVEGYRSEMNGELTEAEKGSFFYAGQFTIYMQALRFLTDYLNNDVYYGEAYEGHNLLRARNQATLLKRLLEKEPALAGL